MTKFNAIAAAVLALAASGSAAAMDAATCHDFIQGTWAVNSAVPGDPVIKVTYNPDGTYQRGNETPSAAPDPAATGSWEAKATKAKDTCEILLMPADAAVRAVNLTRTGDNSFRTADREIATRRPEQMPALIN